MADYYISTLASSGGTGTSEADPWTLDEWMQNATSGDVGWIKADGEYSGISAGTPFTNNGTAANPITMRGYGSVTGDGVRPLMNECSSWDLDGSNIRILDINFSGNASVEVLKPNSRAVFINCNITNAGTGLAVIGDYGIFINCRLESVGASVSGGSRPCFVSCVLKSGGTSTTAAIDGANYVGSVVNCILIGNGFQDGISWSSSIANRFGAVIQGNVFYNFVDAMDFSLVDDDYLRAAIINNIIYNCSGYGIVFGSGDQNNFVVVGNAMGSLTSGRTSGMTSTEEINPIILTGDPFVDSANEDFRLNDVPGAGRECRHARLRPPTV